MNLAALPTPCLVLDRTILQRNIDRMANAVARHGVALRPHMKTAKSIDVARLALQGQPGGITVSPRQSISLPTASPTSSTPSASRRRNWTRSPS
jgi:D-serine deaminase-like pyridoxal phosphate-dependent protein